MTLVGDNRSVNEEYQADASVYWGKGESHEFSKKAWKPVVPNGFGLLLLLPKKSLGWVKNVTFWVIQKNMKFDIKCFENVCYSRGFISSTKA